MMDIFQTMHRFRRAFTLLELMTALMIVSILGVMIISTMAGLKEKAERARCVNNLQGLYAAAAAYVTDNESWPQISTIDITSPAFAQSWIDAFTPYKIGLPNWTCATVQRAIGNPPQDPANPQIDYIPSTFGPGPSAPWKYPTQPWFIERADAHGDGNLLIFTNGQVHSLKSLIPKKN